MRANAGQCRDISSWQRHTWTVGTALGSGVLVTGAPDRPGVMRTCRKGGSGGGVPPRPSARSGASDSEKARMAWNAAPLVGCSRQNVCKQRYQL
jgi:hypothetical protein